MYPDIWANFSQNHTCYFLRARLAVKTIRRRPGFSSRTCRPKPFPHRGIPGREEKQSSSKSQALISVNHILCKTFPLLRSWNSSKYLSRSFLAVQGERRRNLGWTGQSGPDSNIPGSLPTCSILRSTPHHLHHPPRTHTHFAQSSMCFPFSLGVSKQAGAIKGGCGEEADRA